MLIDQQCAFITSSAQSQIERKSTKPVSVEEYLKRLEANIAIYPLMALFQSVKSAKLGGIWLTNDVARLTVLTSHLSYCQIKIKTWRFSGRN